MSASLLRRGLELLEAPGEPWGPAGGGWFPAYGSSNSAPLPVAGRGGAWSGVQRGQDGTRAAGAARRRKRAPGTGRNKATVKGRVVKSAIEEYHKKKAVNHLRENLQYMLKGRIAANKAITEQVLAQNRGRKSKDQPPKKAAKKPEGTVFTEEDFRKFEREYFGRP
ncbi:AROS regulator, partial [Brachypteracias leptosomus]|nr:AROS regulator [Brachypteracias leptosomus]